MICPMLRPGRTTPAGLPNGTGLRTGRRDPRDSHFGHVFLHGDVTRMLAAANRPPYIRRNRLNAENPERSTDPNPQ
jgi:hypothetical protein